MNMQGTRCVADVVNRFFFSLKKSSPSIINKLITWHVQSLKGLYMISLSSVVRGLSEWFS